MKPPYILDPVVEEGGQKKNVTLDINAQNLLMEILIQLKIMNVHLEILTENQIKESDTEE